MSSVVISGDTSGSITLSAPAVAGTVTVTLPAASGTMLTTASSGQSIPKAALPTGSVLQVVSVSKTDAFSTASATFVDITGMSVSITPISATNKIMIFCNIPVVGTDTSSGVGFALDRNGTLINQSTAGTTQNAVAVCYWGSTNNTYGGTSFSFLDSPATTSARTYKIQMLASSGTTVYVNRRVSDTYFGASCTLTVMEVVA